MNGEFFNIRFTAISKSGVVISLEVHFGSSYNPAGDELLDGFCVYNLEWDLSFFILDFSNLYCDYSWRTSLKKKIKIENIFEVNKLFIYIYI